MISRETFRSTLADLAAKAREALPESNGRIDAAVKLVLGGDVELLPDGAANVGSSSDALKQYFVNGSCSCRDYEQAPQQFCKHRLARALAVRLQRTLGPGDPEHQPAARDGDNTTPLPDASTALPDASTAIPAQYLVWIQGKPFVKFAGLLWAAHAQGLLKLETTFVQVTADLALAQCTATFASGLVVTDVADSSPGNVGKQVQAHWIRLSATRAAARALRNALAIDMCSVEEVVHE